MGLNPIFLTAGKISDKLKVDDRSGIEEDLAELTKAHDMIFGILNTIP
jgi:hypothetical protein